MPTPAEFNVDQTVQLAADQFEAAFNGAEVFAARASLTTASIASGFLDAGLSPVLVSSIAGGIIDEFKLRVSMEGGAQKMTSIVLGRDAAALAADSVILVTYSVRTVPPPSPKTSFAPGFPQLPRQPGLTEPEVVYVGPSLSARYICEDLARRAGLSCLYQVHNYQMLEDFNATGSVLDSIRSVVEPFSHFEPSKPDIWVEGSQIIVRARDVGGPASSLSVFDARLSNLDMQARQLGRIRILRLTGGVAINPRFLAVDPGQPVDDSPFAAGVGELETIENTDETVQQGRVVKRVVLRETRRVRDHAVLASHDETYLETVVDGIRKDLRLVSTLDVASDWQPLQLGYPNRIVNSPKELTRTSTTEGLTQIQDRITGETTFVWEPKELVIMSQTYDKDTRFLLSQTTSKDTWDPDQRSWSGAPTWEIKSYQRNGAGTYQVTTVQHASDGTPGAPTRTTAGGPPPAGPGRRADGRSSAPPPTRQPGDQTPIPGIPVTYAAVIDGSNGVGSRDFSLRNPNLLENDLLVIAGQAKQASGKKELEFSFTAAGIPWLRRGQRLQLTGLEDEAGGSIPIQLALVTECRHEFREGRAYLSHVKACWWE